MSAWKGEVVGHRGAAGLAPENTLAAFEKALELKVDRVEFDVRATLDGAVVFHDQRLDRFQEDTGSRLGKPLSRMTTAEITRLDVGRWLGRPGCFVPTYDQVLRALKGRVKLNVEAKGSGADGLATVRACIRGVRAHALEADSVLSSFHEAVLRTAAGEAPEIPRAFIADERTSGDPVEIARGVEAVALHAEDALVDSHLLARCHAAGLQLKVWTVDEEGPMRRYMEMGVDGIVTDFPDRLLALAGRLS